MKAALFSGNKSGSGKTVITTAVAGYLAKNAVVQTFKTATDYIDSSYLSGVTKRPCCNLDSFIQSEDELRALFAYGCRDADFGIVEGVRGLYEGESALSDAGSTASAAKLLNLPVILIVDAASITRSAAALVLGFQQFDPDVEIAGVILNNIGHGRHAEKAKDAIEHYCKIPVLGAVPKNPGLTLPSRHLGLVPYIEATEKDSFSEDMGRITEYIISHLDMDRIVEIFRDIPEGSPALLCQDNPVFEELTHPVPLSRRIAVAYDEAFCFYYGELDAVFASFGCEIIRFSPIRDELPEADGYFFGGGYPELFAESLSRNKKMCDAVKAAADSGAPVYAECGGLLYLMDSLVTEVGFHDIAASAVYELCGVFSGTAVIPDKKVLGYVEADAELNGKHFALKGHEFHYSGTALLKEYEFSFTLSRGYGISSGKDGVRYKNVLASYTHLMPVSARAFFKEFFCGE